MYLLIPSAKIVGEDLQSLGKLPAVIYPVNGHTVFSYLYKQYDSSCDTLKILCFEHADKVHSKLKKYNNIEIVDIPKLGDLANTIMCGLTSPGEVIINFGDTIVLDNIFDNASDSFFYAKEFVSDKWTYFSCDDGVLTSIEDKKTCDEKSGIKKDVFVGVFYFSDALLLKSCMEEAFTDRDDSMSSFYQAIQIYSKKKPLNAIETSKWFDIGHADKYYNSKLEVKAREFNHIKIDKNRGILTKTSEVKEKFIGEIKWYLKLPSDVEYVRPRIFSYSTDYANPYVRMEYYAYHTVHELFLNGDLDIHQWEKIFERIKFVIRDFKRYSLKDENIILSLEDMYLTKTIQRFDMLKKDARFKAFFQSSILMNGIKYLSLDEIVKKLIIVIPEMLYDVKEFNIIHGDLCFANMMIDNNFSFVKVIDPRGKFGTYDIYGDIRYELAKLFHSVDGKYDYIIKDLFDLDNKDGNISFSIQDKDRDFDLYQVFIDVFKDEIGDSLKKIELIEALLFLSMIPLHGESFEHQLVMLGTGLKILDRVVNIKVEDK